MSVTSKPGFLRSLSLLLFWMGCLILVALALAAVGSAQAAEARVERLQVVDTCLELHTGPVPSSATRGTTGPCAPAPPK